MMNLSAKAPVFTPSSPSYAGQSRQAEGETRPEQLQSFHTQVNQYSLLAIMAAASHEKKQYVLEKEQLMSEKEQLKSEIERLVRDKEEFEHSKTTFIEET